MNKEEIKQKNELLAFLITAETNRPDNETDYEFMEFCSEQLDKYMRMYDPTNEARIKQFDERMAQLLNLPELLDLS